MPSKILVIQGHPDSAGGHFCHGLAQAYARGASANGHEVREIAVGKLEFPMLRNKKEFDDSEPPPAIAEAQELIKWADHLVIIYPLWLGTLPAVLKGFLEQTLRPGFALNTDNPFGGLLKGRSARVVVTMGMPALFYRWFYRAHSLRSLKRNVLKFAGIKPVRTTLIGMVEGSSEKRDKWLTRLEKLGSEGR